MPHPTVMRCLFLTAGLAAIVAASWLASAFSGEPPLPEQPVPVAAPAKAAEASRNAPKYEGTRECIRCHKAPTADDIADKITDFYDLTEYPTWAEKDKHSLAYQVLKNSRSRQMGLLLGIKPETDASLPRLPRRQRRCQPVCRGRPAQDPGEGRELRGLPRASVEVGRRSLASRSLAKGQGPHPRRQERRGFVDLRDAVTGAEVCLSCHVGNAQQGKVVTHEMFAAGHPPISGFEIETFSRAMPQHWKPASAQPPEIQKQYADERGPDKAEAMVSTRMMIIAGLVALKDYARLVGENAKARAGGGRRCPGQWNGRGGFACHRAGVLRLPGLPPRVDGRQLAAEAGLSRPARAAGGAGLADCIG